MEKGAKLPIRHAGGGGQRADQGESKVGGEGGWLALPTQGQTQASLLEATFREQAISCRPAMVRGP